MHYELLYCIAVKGFHTCQANRIPDRGESLRTIRGLTMRSTQHHCNTQIPSGSIVLVAKCPIAGVVKTRLANDIGDKGAASFAHAMLCDVLRQVGLSPYLSNVLKVLLYAPPDDHGLKIMVDVLRSLELDTVWYPMPMLVNSSSLKEGSNCPVSDLISSDLGDKLTNALINVRRLFNEKMRQSIVNDNNGFISGGEEDIMNGNDSCGGGAVVFLGMDSPEVIVEEIASALQSAKQDSTTHICPAYDGGYGMICLPECVPPTIFHGVIWSNPLTCISQLQALGRCGVRNIRVGQLMYDIDESKDILAFAQRLCNGRNTNRTNTKKMCEGDVSSSSSSLPSETNENCNSLEMSETCKHCWDELCKIQVIIPRKSKEDDMEGLYAVNETFFHSSTPL